MTMRPSEVVRRATGYLERHGVESPRESAERLLMHVIGTDRAGLYGRADGLDAREARLFGRALCQRCAGTPLQHLVGEQAFRRLTLRVRSGVFVPRPETEILVEHALGVIEPVERPTVADVGTGTGAIALSLKYERPDARVFALDASPEAADLARTNAQRLGLAVTVLEGDLLSPMPHELLGRLDLVVSNPPYVTPDEYDDLPAEVKAEPRLALLGGVQTIVALAEAARPWLRPGGGLAVEIGASQGEAVATALADGYENARVEPDLAGRDRVVLARRP
jgi:release factor glutamine methyltransferase